MAVCDYSIALQIRLRTVVKLSIRFEPVEGERPWSTHCGDEGENSLIGADIDEVGAIRKQRRNESQCGSLRQVVFRSTEQITGFVDRNFAVQPLGNTKIGAQKNTAGSEVPPCNSAAPSLE